MSNKEKKIKISFPEKLRGGVYANQMYVFHTKEEFIMDFILGNLPASTVNARVIISPGHMKSIVRVLQDNMKKYEDKYGKIEEARPPKGRIGFSYPTKR